MKTFILGIIVTLVVLAAIAFFTVHMGLMDIRADATPSNFETWFAGGGMDNSAERHAPQVKNPLQPTEADLHDGMVIYTMNCAQCHGDPKTPKSPLGTHEYPRAPQFLDEPADMPQNQNFYIIKHGIKLTAMPGWENTLNDQQIWKVVSFLANMEKLPPAVEQDWKGNAAPQPAAQPAEKPHKHGHS
jgi:mono/diheme cytochrome c family protein